MEEFGADKINGVTVNNQGEIAVTGSYLSSDLYLNEDRTDTNSTLKHFRKSGTTISVTSTKNAFLSVYSNDGEYLWSQNIPGQEVWGSSITSTNLGFVVTLNAIGSYLYLNTAKTVSIPLNYNNTDGIIAYYKDDGQSIKYQKISTTSNDEVYNVIQDKDENIIVVGSHSARQNNINYWFRYFFW